MAFEPADHVGERITVTGTAVDARAGAVVVLADNTPIHLPGLSEWDDGVSCRTIEASGILRVRPSRIPATPAGGDHHHGVGETFILDQPSWVVVEGA